MFGRHLQKIWTTLNERATNNKTSKLYDHDIFHLPSDPHLAAKNTEIYDQEQFLVINFWLRPETVREGNRKR